MIASLQIYPMAGLYIHIPFCKSKCGYCGFYSLPSLKLKDIFLEALKQEIVQKKDYLSNHTIHTVYFGGGTPSLLSVAEIGSLLESQGRGSLVGCHLQGRAESDTTEAT